MALERLGQIFLARRGIARVALQQKTHLLPQQTPDHDIVIETEVERHAMELVVVECRIVNDSTHLSDQTLANRSIASPEAKTPSLSLEKLMVDSLLDRGRQLIRGRRSPLGFGHLLTQPLEARLGKDDR